MDKIRFKQLFTITKTGIISFENNPMIKEMKRKEKMLDIKQIDLGMVNAYLLEADDGYILVDTGVSQMFPKIMGALTKAGCSQENLKMIILTHGDMDHVGSAVALKKEYGAKLAMHEADYPMVREGKPLQREAKGLLWKIMSKMNQRPGKPNLEFEVDIFLTDNQRLDEYGVPAKIMHIPGHTPGSIAILTDDGQLIGGDIIANQRKPALTPLVENREQIQASVEKIKQANPKMVYPGHGKPFDGEALKTI
jgi:hydroxyacylglutathione hydrolase